MKRVLPVLVAAILLAGCGTQAQEADQVKALEQRIQALEQRQQELEAQLEQAKKERADLAKTLTELKAAQQSAQARQEELDKRIEEWAKSVQATVNKAVQKRIAAAQAECEDPDKALQRKLQGVDFSGLTVEGAWQAIETIRIMADMAVREYEACMRAAGGS